MKHTVLDLQEFIDVLEQLKESGTESIIITAHDGFPAIVDADKQDSIFVFKHVDDIDDGEQVH